MFFVRSSRAKPALRRNCSNCSTRNCGNWRRPKRDGGHHRPLWFSADGTQLLSINQSRRTTTRDDPVAWPATAKGAGATEPALEFLELLRVSDLAVLRSVPLVAAGAEIGAVAMSPDGKRLALSWRGKSEVSVYATATSEVVRSIVPRSGSGSVLAASERAGRLFYETLSKLPHERRGESKNQVSLILVNFERKTVSGPNRFFNQAVERCDTDRDGTITEEEAAIFSAAVKAGAQMVN